MATPAPQKVRVAVRLKPERSGRRAAFVSRSNCAVTVGDKTYAYDHVYDEECSQQHLYESSVAPLVLGCFKGFNATVFAYGQTGSGKTHSIVGLPRVEEDEGIIPRAVRQIFNHLRADRSGRVVSLHISFLEIYNDECRDLLHPDIQSRDIMIREDRDGRIFFTGAREEVVTSVDDALYYLERGNLSRTTAETYMNASSSRSHAIFTVSIELFEYSPPAAPAAEDPAEMSTENTYIQSKLHLVDLAGSERAKRTGAEGVRLKESVGINQGLLALGKVIRALTAGGKSGEKQTHVPYRESKLTRFLQDSLGGNSRTIMLACISPTEINVHETLSTLQYASRARAVQNKVVANVSVGHHNLPPEVDSSMVGALRTQLQVVQAELDAFRSAAAASALQQQQQQPKSPQASAAPRQLSGLDISGLRRSREVSSSPRRGGPRGSNAPKNDDDAVAIREIMRVVAEAQSALEDAYTQLGASARSPQDCGVAWRVVVACADAAVALEDALEQYKSIEMRASISFTDSLELGKVGLGSVLGLGSRPNNHNNNHTAAEEEELRSLRAELEECKEDLKRDEDIFAEKVRELKQARRQIRDLQQELQDAGSRLSEALVLVEEQKRALDSQIVLATAAAAATVQRRAPRDVDSSAQSKVAAEHLVASASTASREKTPVKSRPSPRKTPPSSSSSSRQRESLDDLEISIAVAVTEPDISQLMEDLEAVSREKEKVVNERNQAESKCLNVSTAAEQQREEFRRGQEELQKRLKDLEINIRLKQELIADLTRGQNQATQLAERHEARVLLLEQEQAQLQGQLNFLNQARRQTFDEAEEERSRRKELESKLLEAREQLASMEQQKKKQEKQWRAEREAAEKRRQELKKTEEHLAELTSLQSSYARLTAQLEHNEQRHRKDLDALTAQVAQFKRSSAEAQATIKNLEAKNGDLRARLERSAKSRERPSSSSSGPRSFSSSSSVASGAASTTSTPPALPGHSSSHSASRPRSRLATSSSSGASPARAKAWERGDDTSVASEYSHGSRTVASAQSAGSSASSAARRASRQMTSDWVLQRVEELTLAKQARVEVSKLVNSCRAAEKERGELIAELEQLKLQQKDGQVALKKQLREVESRADKLAQLAKVHKADLGACPAGDESRKQELLTKLSATEKALRATIEHRAELDTRLHNGVLSADTLSRMQDVQDELETLDTEISLNEVRIEEERRRISKGKSRIAAASSSSSEPGPNGGRGGAQAHDPPVNTLLYQEMEDLTAGSGGMMNDQERALLVTLAQISQSLVEAKYRAGVDSSACASLQSKLEEKQNECDELVNTMHKARGDAMRRHDQLKAESEEKIAYLLAQLRGVESKLMETSSSLRRSQDLSLLAASQERDRAAGVRSSGVGLLRASDAELGSIVQQLKNDKMTEVFRRWQSERERREALEKRNSELLREVRALKSSL